MGEVYLAQDTSELGRTVALKIVSAEVAKDRDRLQRFTQEARTVSNLNHPNILTINVIWSNQYARQQGRKPRRLPSECRHSCCETQALPSAGRDSYFGQAEH